MTSAEFAAKYRVLKTLTEHGARSQIAQEVALGRMMMVHHLDVGTPAERQRIKADVAALEPAAAAKVFGIVNVDGTDIVLTQFLATFTDLPTWLRQNVSATEAATLVMAAVKPPQGAPQGAPQAAAPRQETSPPPPKPAPAPQPAKPASPGSFTAMFGAAGSSA